MKILLVNKFHYIKGGSETYYLGLGRLLETMGHTVIYFSMKDEKNIPCGQQEYFVENVDFNKKLSKVQMMKTAGKMLYSFEAARKFKRLIEDEKPDIIHLNIFQSQLTGSIIDVAQKYHIPIVYTAHELKCICPNYQMLCHGSICENCMGGHYYHCFLNGCMKNSKAKSLLASMEAYVYKWNKTYSKIQLLITPSEFYKRKIEKENVVRCPVIHMANFLPEKTLYPNDIKVGNYILYFGRLGPEKGIMKLVQAFFQANLNIPLYIVGDGPMLPQIKKLICELDLENSIRLLGFKEGEELKKIVEESRCVCLPSEWYENGPYSIMEAMAMGKPAIVSDIGGLPELVEDGITGYIVKHGDVETLSHALKKMEELTSERIVTMGKEAQNRAKQKFNPYIYVDKLILLYKRLL
ncbi:MAG: glycosyltransferase family 4 protein [Eubacterium sp.]|nr:glycosyltransferase family 4 protein [Eubacterium sp.]